MKFLKGNKVALITTDELNSEETITPEQPKFTLGPWRWDDSDERIYSEDHGEICIVEYEANARLIAASPALYAVLSEIVKCDVRLPFGLLKQAEEALKLAEEGGRGE